MSAPSVGRLRLATRGSALALAQARQVEALLRAAHPGLDLEIVEIRTTGDRLTDVPLGPHIGQSFFTKEIEDALLDGRAELAVHSCKDLATVLPEGLALGALLRREDPRDVLVSQGDLALDALPRGARVATASVRRKAFLALARPDLELVDLRGNVPTRLRVVDDGGADAVVLAAAGLHRLDLHGRVSAYLDPDVVVPAAAQGAIAIQIRSDDAATAALLETLDHAPTRTAVTAERACLRRLEAGCQAPVGCLATLDGDRLTVRTAAVLPGRREDAAAIGAPTDAEAIGRQAAEALLETLGVTSFRAAGAWAGPPPLRDPAP